MLQKIISGGQTGADREEHFGTIAQNKGYISWPQLLEALEIQIEENTEKGEDWFIGDVLCDLEFMTKLQVRDVLESMEKATTERISGIKS